MERCAACDTFTDELFDYGTDEVCYRCFMELDELHSQAEAYEESVILIEVAK